MTLDVNNQDAYPYAAGIIGWCDDISKQTVSAWKSGDRTPKRPTVITIASFFNVSVPWLLGVSDDDQAGFTRPLPSSLRPIQSLRRQRVPLIGKVAAGKPIDALPDARAFKKRTAALISVGGAMTENWIALTLPMMYEFTFPWGIDVIDAVEYYGAMAHESVLGYPEMMERMTKVGRHIVASLNAETEEERLRWRGDEEGVCPVCHTRLLQVSHDKKTVDCVVCGSHGTLSIADGKIRVDYTQEELDRSRLRWGGKLEHSTEIKTQAQPAGTIKNLKELKQPYADFVRPPFPREEAAHGNLK